MMSVENQGDMIISLGSTIEGKLLCSGSIQISGRVSGEIKCDILIVHKEGAVEGAITCKDAKVMGIVTSELNVDEHLFIDSTGKVSGKCSYGKLEIAKGGILQGDLLPIKSNKKKNKDVDEDEIEDQEQSSQPKIQNVYPTKIATIADRRVGRNLESIIDTKPKPLEDQFGVGESK